MRIDVTTIGALLVTGILVYIAFRWSDSLRFITPTPLESFLASRGLPDTQVLMTVYKVDWCPHCQKLKPSVDKLQELLRDRPVPGCQLEVVDCEKDQRACRDAGVRSYPTILVRHSGRPVADPLPLSVNRHNPEAMYRYLRGLAG